VTHFHLPQLFAVAATLKSIDYNVSTTLILNINSSNNNNIKVFNARFRKNEPAPHSSLAAYPTAKTSLRIMTINFQARCDKY